MEHFFLGLSCFGSGGAGLASPGRSASASVPEHKCVPCLWNKYYADKTIPEAEDDLPDAESKRESVDGSQSSAALNIIVPDDQSPAGAFQFESTV